MKKLCALSACVLSAALALLGACPAARPNSELPRRAAEETLTAFADAALSQQDGEAKTETLRVGYFAFSGYHDLDETGRRSGYGYEFLQRLATYADWVYEYDGYDLSYADSLERLKSGEIDILTSVSKTEEREKDFLFSRRDIGTNSTIFTVKAGNNSVVKGDYSTYEGLAIGMLEDNSKNANFEAFAEQNGFSYSPRYFETQDDLSAALENGEVDGIVTGSLRALHNEWLIESFAASPFYVCTLKSRPDLMAQIDAAIDEMDLHEPDWRNALNDAYYSTDSAGRLVFSPEERAYLAELGRSGKPIRALFNPDRAPYSYFENGEAKGIFPALFEAIAEKLGIPYEFISVKDREEYEALRSAGEADVVLDFSYDYPLAEREGYKITAPYFTAGLARLVKTDFKGEVKKIAAPRNADLLISFVDSHFGAEKIETYPSLEACVEAVRKGKADAAILYSHSAELFLRKDSKKELDYFLIGEASLSYSLAVTQDSFFLLSLLNKGVSSLDESKISAVTLQETESYRDSLRPNLSDILYSNPVVALLGVTLLLLFVFVSVLLIVRVRNQHNLQAKITEATAALEAQKEELSAALHAADAANRSKTTFLNNMSHDIRTPMNAIIGFTALATTHLDNRERALDYLTKITQASNHLLSLINDVLDMSRIESGKMTIEERPENLSEILQGLRNIIQSDIHAKQLELFIDTVDVVNEEIFCDKLRLNQVLLNLASNAIKFTGPGGSVSIRVTQKPSDREGFGLYEFKVSDTGIGMSPEFAQSVFEPFTRERNSTVSGIQGTGLGMAITKNIVTMMGGSIEVRSEQGKGTEFTVLLTFRLAETKEAPSYLEELEGLYALVVDDDLVSCQSVSKLLRQIGMIAQWTLTGKEAVVRTSEAVELGHPFEVFIVDWSMPDMNGIETVRRIRQIIGDDSPIILMSAYDWADIEAEAKEAGVTGFISKPLFASDLHKALEKSLGQKREEKREISRREERFVGKRILLAEDNELNREIAEEILREAGFAVESAENGQVACDKLASARPDDYDLVLMDIQMPILNGYEAAKRIRAMKDPKLSAIPIIAMTANAFEEDRAAAIAAGMDGHLAKPIDIDRMMSLLHEIFDKNET